MPTASEPSNAEQRASVMQGYLEKFAHHDLSAVTQYVDQLSVVVKEGDKSFRSLTFPSGSVVRLSINHFTNNGIDNTKDMLASCLAARYEIPIPPKKK
jgi:hypothetical protein